MAVYAVCEKCGYQTRREKCPQQILHKRYTTWIADVRIDGKRIKKFYGSDLENPKELADSFARGLKTDHERGKLQLTKLAPTLFGALADKYWIEHAMVEGRKPERSTFYTVELWKEWIGVERKVSPLTEQELTVFQNDMRSLQRKLKSNSLSGSTINRYFNIGRSILERGREWGMVKVNPLEFVSRVQEEEPAPRFLEQNEIDRLFDAAGCLKDEAGLDIEPARRQRLLNFMLVISHTGARPSSIEECDQENGDVDLKNKVLWFTTYKGGRHHKKHRYPVPIDDELFPLIVQRAEETGRKGPIFDCRDMRKLCELAIAQSKVNEGKPENRWFTMYGLKHCYASHLLMMGSSLDEIGELLGHTDGRMVKKHYGHFTLTHLRKVQSRINLTPQLKVI